MDIFISAVIFLVGVVLVVKGGDWFVDAASWIARAASIPPFIIGATIVSLATTLPEMIVSVVASLEGKNDMVVGNAVGSVTANTGLIMGIAFVFMTVIASRKDYLKQCILLLFSAIVLYVGSLGGRVSTWACVLLLAAFLTSMAFNISGARKGPVAKEKTVISKKDIFKNVVFFVLGAGGIVVGSNLLIEGGSDIALALGVPERVIAVTMVAIGTSLPELVTTVTAIRKKEAHLSIGNIIGANIIDLSLILPLCTFVSGGEFSVSAQCLKIDFPACLVLSFIALIPIMLKERAYKVQGAAMLLVYGAYLIITV